MSEAPESNVVSLTGADIVPGVPPASDDDRVPCDNPGCRAEALCARCRSAVDDYVTKMRRDRGLM